MTGFTVTDELTRSIASAVHEDFVAHAFDGEACNHETDVDYSCKDLMTRSIRAALEAAARTAQPAPSQFSAPAPAPLGLALYPTGPPPPPSTLDRESLEAAVAAGLKDLGIKTFLLTDGSPWPQESVVGHVAGFVRSAILALVPQPTPVVDRRALEDLIGQFIKGWPDGLLARSHVEQTAEALLTAGVFKTEAEVRATAIEEVAEAYLYDGDRDSQLPGYVALIECAAAIRAGGTNG